MGLGGPERPQQPFQQTAQFFLNDPDPRTQEIRDLLIQGMKLLLSYDRATGDEKLPITGRIEHQAGRLIGLGIEPGMHCGRPPEFFAANPRATVESLAGQFLDVLALTGSEDMSFLELHGPGANIENTPSSLAIDNSDVPRFNLIVRIGAIEGLSTALDAREEVFGE